MAEARYDGYADWFDRELATSELARVSRPEAPLVHQGAHPCFVGPHSRVVAAEGVPTLHTGYWQTERYTEAPGISPHGLRAKVGATHLPLGRDYPYFVTTRWRSPAGGDRPRRRP